MKGSFSKIWMWLSYFLSPGDLCMETISEMPKFGDQKVWDFLKCLPLV